MSQTPTRSDPPDSEHRGLPMVVAQPDEPQEGWLTRVMRILFGWKAAATRADLEQVLTAEQPQSGFSPEEAAMLKNILGLRECRIESVMVPRADIVAVQQDIAIGELVRVFEVAAHSRLVVYNDTLDDPTGMIHIRDLIAFMAARASAEIRRSRPQAKRRTQADLDFGNVDLAMPLVGGEDRSRNPLRAAVDAGARSARQDAGDAHSPGAGHRRIRRHRRTGVDGRPGRIDRRRHRRRA